MFEKTELKEINRAVLAGLNSPALSQEENACGESLDELSALLEAVEVELGNRAVRGGDRRRLLRAAGLVRQLREAAGLNVNAGQLAGWLCAGMFDSL